VRHIDMIYLVVGKLEVGELLVSLADSIPEEAHPLNGYL